MSKNLSGFENATIGALGGFFDVTLLQSLNHWKNAAQQGLPFETNPRKLYRGYVVNVINNSGCVMAQFAVTGLIQRLIARGEARKLTDGEVLVSALTAGFVTGAACGPLELAMIQQQRKGGTLVGTFRNLFAGGPSVLSRGVLGISLRESIYCGLILGASPVLRERIKQNFPDTLGKTDDSARFAAVMMAGPFCSLASHPFDTYKTCMQGDIERVKFGTMRETHATLMKERGITSLWAGTPWRLTRQIAAAFIIDKVASELSPMIFPHRFN
eukprot:TRINITY_DN101941_c0_g1_i1.p1 TRINITY_DN101941_c0_g1~~TRINITY_DN101941_c0_g1_i1.p1  ORF type:complete len:271 (+),score=29.02 TRINITY_DN101941_c0_g1_i1:63-875(+)